MLYLTYLVIVVIYSSSIRAFVKNNRIVGGSRAPTPIPYQVALLVNNRLQCGGSILTGNCILTAAHCVKGVAANSITVRAGFVNLDSNTGITRRVSQTFVPIKYNAMVLNFDVAILKLESPLSGPGIALIAMNNEKMNIGDMLMVSGWGLQKSTDTAVSNQLRSVFVPAISKRICSYQYPGELTDTMFCAQSSGGGQDACSGDSGGPIVRNNKQYGIVSWGNGCGQANYAGVYTTIKKVLPWINQIKLKYCY